MSVTDILTIVFGILSVAVSILAYYFQVKSTLTKKVNGLINDEEDTKNIGEAKKAEVVEQLYALVPIMFKGVFNKQFLGLLVQEAFDKIEEYAQKQIK